MASKYGYSVEIDNKTYDVAVLSLTESFEKMYSKKTGRSSAKGLPMILDCLGTFYSHEIEVACKEGHEKDFDDLYHFFAKPRNEGFSALITLGTEQCDYRECLAYSSSGAKQLKKISADTGRVYWNSFTFKLTPMKAQEIM